MMMREWVDTLCPQLLLCVCSYVSSGSCFGARCWRQAAVLSMNWVLELLLQVCVC